MSRDGKKTGGRAWVPGQSGNPKGRPLCPLKAAIREELSKKKRRTIAGKRRTLTKNEILINVLWEKAEEGDPKAIQMLWDRGYGKPDLAVDLIADITTNGGPEVSLAEMQQIWKRTMAEDMMAIQVGGNGKNGGKNGK